MRSDRARQADDNRTHQDPAAPLGRCQCGHEPHDAGDDEPGAEDQREHHERVEGLLDQYEAGDRAERLMGRDDEEHAHAG